MTQCTFFLNRALGKICPAEADVLMSYGCSNEHGRTDPMCQEHVEETRQMIKYGWGHCLPCDATGVHNTNVGIIKIVPITEALEAQHDPQNRTRPDRPVARDRYGRRL